MTKITIIQLLARLRILIVSILFLFINIMTSFPVSAVDYNGNEYNGPDPGNNIIFYDGDIVGECSPTVGAGGGSASTVGVSFSLGTGEALRQKNLIQALMTDYGLTAAQGAGVVGNFMTESGGLDLPPDINEGGSKGPPRFSGGYGWAQWTGGRQVSFITFAVDNNYMSSKTVNANDAANYAYLKKELNESYQETISDLKKQKSAEDAAVSFEATFERAGVPALEKRKANAVIALAAYNGGGATGGSTSTTDACGASAGESAIVGNTAFPLQGTKKVVLNPGMFKDNDAALGGHPYTAYDILANTGTPVVAFLSGTVTSITTDRCPGQMVSIFNKESDLTISYLHMATNTVVKKGQEIAVGEKVGTVGTLQNGCTVPHLHIDAAKGPSRPGCSRLSCPASNKQKFVSIGPKLYQTFQAMAD